jgi:AcrR family transcriptional regulator
MKATEHKRSYQMIQRAEQVALNDRKIIEAMADLWLELPLSELTLDKVSQRSGVTVRTILRKFGSKEGLFKACIEIDGERFTSKRMQVKPGDLPGIVDALLEEYERMGNALIRTLTVEYEYPATQTLLHEARKFHREWCIRVFEPFLCKVESGSYEIVLSAFITATEFYLWKLLRKDMGKSMEHTRRIFLFSLQSLAANANNNK